MTSIADDNRHILTGQSLRQMSDKPSALPRPQYGRRRSLSATRSNVRFSDERVTLNVGGVRFQTLRATLRRCPGTLLAELTEGSKYFDEQRQEFFFDRSAALFDSVLEFSRTGSLHFDAGVCAARMRREMAFWRISPSALDDCCFLRIVDDEERRDERRRLRDVSDEARATQRAIVDDLRERPPADKAQLTSKIFDFLQDCNVYPDFRLMLAAFADCRRQVTVFVALLTSAVIILAVLLRIFEPAEVIPDLRAALWWALVTLTTVGHGDARPRSFLGGLVASVGVVFGIIVVSLPLPLVARVLINFRQRMQETRRLVERDRDALDGGVTYGRRDEPTDGLASVLRGREVNRKKVV